MESEDIPTIPQLIPSGDIGINVNSHINLIANLNGLLSFLFGSYVVFVLLQLIFFLSVAAQLKRFDDFSFSQ